MARPKRKHPEAFWERVNKAPGQGPQGDCWQWTGAIFLFSGYGRYDNHIASRASWMLHNGPVPEGLQICHTCDNRLCVNPAHLYAGTPLQNIRDSFVRKRRHNFGENHPRARLTCAQALEIYQSRLAGESQLSVSRRFNVQTSTVFSIMIGRSWAHVTMPEKSFVNGHR